MYSAFDYMKYTSVCMNYTPDYIYKQCNMKNCHLFTFNIYHIPGWFLPLIVLAEPGREVDRVASLASGSDLDARVGVAAEGEGICPGRNFPTAYPVLLGFTDSFSSSS